MGATQCCGIQVSDSSELQCCEIQQAGDVIVGHRILLHVPAGFTYLNTARDKTESFRKDDQHHHDLSFKHQKTAPTDMKEVSESTRSSATGGFFHPSDGSFRSSGSFRSTTSSSWIEVPAPLNNWTKEEQQIFMDILDEFPKAGRIPTQMELAIVKAKKLIPFKSVHDFHLCFKHLQASRVAYFGI
jgi:hypothetical protein